ncbi:Arm DNA-binding domain-containing protein [Streptomyces sp. uw30]|nr:Arm DNA-binding domain-containing protein [Streptomyces sp. uw30]
MVDVGIDPTTGKRKQLTRTFGTLKEAKAEYRAHHQPSPGRDVGIAE